MRNLFNILLFFCLFSCTKQCESKHQHSATMYFNGDILTMKGDTASYAEAIVTNGKHIAYVGSKKGALTTFPDSIQKDLKGNTLIPGFIDAHAHFAAFSAQAIGANLLPPPDGKINKLTDIVDTLKKWSTKENIKMTGWIFGLGFDDSVIKEKRFPTRDDLDQVSTTVPVIVIHISGHLAIVNSKGLEVLGYSEKTKNPKGGKIRRFPGTKKPNGVLEELAIIPYMSDFIAPKSKEAASKFFDAGQSLALSYGYTTAQEGRAFSSNHSFLTSAAETGKLKIDVVSYVDYTEDKLLETKWYSKDKYINHYRIGGIKLSLDGSPQGRTAWISHPYKLPPPGEPKDYKGYPIFQNDKDVFAIYDKVYKNDWQILTHANGDAAMDQMLRAIAPAFKKYGKKDRRNVLIHGQYIRMDQLKKFFDLDIIASLFPLHTFYWGDWHTQLIGKELASKISPTRSAINSGLKLTIHTDAPIALPNLMRLVWTAVARTSRSGKVIGAEERLSPYEALQALTIWSAYQHFEEDKKGSIETKKLADLVILDKNPLKVKVDEIKDIIVLETIKESKLLYKRP